MTTANRQPNTGPPHADRSVIHFLKHRDAPCPVCGFNLRGFTADRCPECGHKLALTLATARPLLAAWTAALLVTAMPTGFAAVIALGILILLASPDTRPVLGPLEHAALTHAALGSAAIATLLAARRRLLALTATQRWGVVATLAALNATGTLTIVLLAIA
jgi:hypothetical protein